MGFLNILGDVAKVAAPIVGSAFGPLGTLAGAGLSKVISGAQQGSEASKLAAENPRPVDAPEDAYYQNEQEADQRAQQGMASQQYENSENNIQRNQNLGVRLAQNSGNPLAALGNIVATGDNATNSLNQQDQIDKTQNQDQDYQIRHQLAARQQQAFDWNDKQKFLENASAIRALNAASQQNMFSGLNTFAGGSNQTMGPYGQMQGSPSTLGNGFTGLLGKGLKGLTGLFSGGSSGGSGAAGAISSGFGIGDE